MYIYSDSKSKKAVKSPAGEVKANTDRKDDVNQKGKAKKPRFPVYTQCMSKGKFTENL